MKLCFGLLIVFACPEDKPIPISDYCQQARIIRLDREELARMTAESKLQIAKHNTKWKRLCQVRK